MITDSWTQSLWKRPKSAAGGGLTSCKSKYFPSIFKGDLMLKQNLRCYLLHLMAQSHQMCQAGQAAHDMKVWEHEAVKCSCAGEVDLLCLSARLLVLKPSLTRLWSPTHSPRHGCPLLHMLSASSQFSWAPGGILASALRSSSMQEIAVGIKLWLWGAPDLLSLLGFPSEIPGIAQG